MGNGAQVIIGDGLANQTAAHGQHLDVNLGALLDGVCQAEGDVKVRAGGKQAVLCPDGCLIGFHLLGGCHSNVCAAGNHPGADADALGENHRALGSALPQGTGEVAVSQRQDVGQRDDVGGMAVINHAVCAVGSGLADAVVHKVAGELAGRLGTLGQTPDDAPAVALVIDFDNADAVNRVRLHVAEELAGAGGDEILTGQIVGLNAHIDPLAGLSVKVGAAGSDVLLGHTVGQVAAVALVPALQPAIVAHTDKALHAGNFIDCRHCYCSFI